MRIGLVLFALAWPACTPSGPGPAPSSSAGAAASQTLAPPPSAEAPPPEHIAAQQILITYKGAALAPKHIARSKEDARALAQQVLAELLTNTAGFSALAEKRNEDPYTKPALGKLGRFKREAMPESVGDASFKLEVGEVSGLVESPRGFHILQRTE